MAAKLTGQQPPPTPISFLISIRPIDFRSIIHGELAQARWPHLSLLLMYRDNKNEWRWIYYATNKKEIAVSSESYTSKKIAPAELKL